MHNGGNDMESLAAYIPMDCRQAMVRGKDLPDRTSGAALFADISGFTPLTEALVKELGPRRGVEELTRQLNLVYGALIAEVHHGELRIKTGPGFRGAELQILTTEGRIEITGTVVSVYKGEGFTCVCVLEGTAKIGMDKADLEEIPAGMRKVMFADGRPPMVTEIQPQHEAGLMEFEERYRNFFPR